MAIQYKAVNWAKQAVLYEVNIRQYTPQGTFKAFEQYLPTLKNMGVNCLWLMPITPISVKGRQGSLGSYYACSSYTKINPEFGTEDDFKNLVQAAHALNIKVIIDWVANHTGCDHEWTNNKDWYVLDEAGNFTERNGWIDVIDLNYNSQAMQTAMIEAMQYWVNCFDIDGFRCDMAHLVTINFWHKARTTCDAVKPLYWLAECDEDEYLNVFDTNYAWRWMHTTEALAKGNGCVQDIINPLLQQPLNSSKLLFTSNHDENSWTGTEYQKFDKLAKPLAVLTFLFQQHTPLIYSGQENANKNRLKFFDKDCLQWQQPNQLHQFYQTLTLLKTQYLQQEHSFQLLNTNNHCVAPILLYNHQMVVFFIANFSNNNVAVKCSINHPLLKGKFKNLFNGLSYNLSETENFELLAGDYLLLLKQF